MEFAPLERKRLSDAVVEKIVELVGSGVYEVGDKLPSERDLATSLQVSRTLVRESFRMLESIGMVEVRPGFGTVVTQTGPNSADIARYLWTHPVETLEVIEVSEALSLLAGELAAERITTGELRELKRLWNAQQTALEIGAHKELVRLDEMFHTMIYQAARNGVLRALHSHSRQVLNNIQWNYLTLASRSSLSIAEHGEIIQVLELGDPNAAGEALRNHSRRTLASLRKLAGDKLRPFEDPGRNCVSPEG